MHMVRLRSTDLAYHKYGVQNYPSRKHNYKAGEPDPCKAIHEVFAGFEERSETTGEGIAKKWLESLSSHGLDLEKLRGQAYDGCASMKGHINGVQAHIKRQYPTAIYIHCASHVCIEA